METELRAALAVALKESNVEKFRVSFAQLNYCFESHVNLSVTRGLGAVQVLSDEIWVIFGEAAVQVFIRRANVNDLIHCSSMSLKARPIVCAVISTAILQEILISFECCLFRRLLNPDMQPENVVRCVSWHVSDLIIYIYSPTRNS